MLALIDITVNIPDIVNFYDWHGEMRLNTMGGGTINIWAADNSIIRIMATCTAGTINIYGNAQIINAARGTAVHDYTINAHVQELVEGHKGLYESWQDEFIDDTIWAPRVEPATGIPWAAGASGAFLYCRTTPNASEIVRLRGRHLWVQNWLAAPVNLAIKRLVMEFEFLLGVPANLDNALCFFGLMPTAVATRATNNLIGFGLAADVLQTVTDAGGAETLTTGFGETLTNHNKLRLEIMEAEVRFFVNEQLVATHAATVPQVPMYPTFYAVTEAGGACAIAVGVIKVEQETIARY